MSGSRKKGAKRGRGRKKAVSEELDVETEYHVNDIVLNRFRDGKYYVAKVLRITIEKNEDNSYKQRYHLHFHGWGKRHDEWVYLSEETLLPDNEATL